MEVEVCGPETLFGPVGSLAVALRLEGSAVPAVNTSATNGVIRLGGRTLHGSTTGEV